MGTAKRLGELVVTVSEIESSRIRGIWTDGLFELYMKCVNIVRCIMQWYMLYMNTYIYIYIHMQNLS